MNCLLQEIPSFVCAKYDFHISSKEFLMFVNRITRLQNYFCSVPLLMNWVEAERYLVSD